MAKKKENATRRNAAMEEMAERHSFDMVNHATELRRLQAEYTHRLRLEQLATQLELKALESEYVHVKSTAPLWCFMSFVAGVALGLLVMALGT